MTQSTQRKKLAFTKNRVFRFLATIKFAIPTLFLFAAAMIYGTVYESLYGTAYANRAVYHSFWFYLIQLAIVVSLFLSMLDRIPFRKRLTGFYLVHTSLLIIFGGAILTRYFGIDGSLELSKDDFRGSVRLNEDRVILTDGKQEYSPLLPVALSPKNLSGNFQFMDGAEASLLKFIPFAKPDLKMIEKPGTWSSRWLLSNDRFEESLNLSLGGEASGTPSRWNEGPLQVEIVSEPVFAALSASLAANAHSDTEAPKTPAPASIRDARYILIYSGGGNYHALSDLEKPFRFKNEGHSFQLEKAHNKKAGISFFRLTTSLKKGDTNTNSALHFIPRYSPQPFSNHLETVAATPFRLYELEELRKKPTVLLTKTSGGMIRFTMGKGSAWQMRDFKNEPVLLPWMGLKLTLIRDYGASVPEIYYTTATPSKEEEKNIKAALIRVQSGGKSEEFWITDRSPSQSKIANVEGMIRPNEFYLPFQLKLERFKMDTIPGTDKPASYESFVQLKGSEQRAHIYMNNPLKRDGFTLYQASYFQDERGEYRSVLSVNRDPGRPIKYFGSLLLVLGLIFHFSIIYGYIRFKDA